jgi:hypothetical protein
MAITKQQAIDLPYGGEIHYGECKRIVGPRGGETITQERWRKSGQCKTWKRSPEKFRLPIKHGMYDNSYLDQTNCINFHLASDCPLGDLLEYRE